MSPPRAAGCCVPPAARHYTTEIAHTTAIDESTAMSEVADGDQFDFIIAGAGTAGCVLANRLSADPAIRVCLIEAGGRDRNPFIHIPTALPMLMQHPTVNWRFWTTEQPGAAGRKIYVPRGKVIGGTSSINGMVYMRGNRRDYDDWSAAGNAGWSYREVLPYFRRSENNERLGDSPFHGKGGPMNVRDVGRVCPLVAMMCKAAAELQLPMNDDFNGAEQDGFGARQLTYRAGRRVSGATAFLDPIRHRNNLTVIMDALLDRVIFDGRRATRAEIVTPHGRLRLTAKREVILSGGAIASPLMLMRSGIGPGAQLAAHGITVMADRPGVGANLQDHMAILLQHITRSTLTYGLSWRTAPRFARGVIQYALLRSGVLADNPLHANGFIRSRPGLDRPDLQIILNPLLRTKEGRNGIGHGYGFNIILLRPKSHGTVALTGADPNAPPLIDPRFFSADGDIDTLLRGVKFVRRLFESRAWDKVRGAEYLPGEHVQDDAGLTEFIRKHCATAFHPVGTCRMGADTGSVVDPQLRVRGVQGLRVVDASIMPTIIGGNTNAPTVMIAEKASDMILGRAPPRPAEIF
jgi:choline dehydrogenase